MRDRLTYHPDGEHIIYLDTKGHEVFTNFQYCPSVGYTCYFDSQGYLYKDQITFVGNNVFYHWNGMVARGLISDGAYYYSMDNTDGHYLGQFPVSQ